MRGSAEEWVGKRTERKGKQNLRWAVVGAQRLSAGLSVCKLTGCGFDSCRLRFFQVHSVFSIIISNSGVPSNRFLYEMQHNRVFTKNPCSWQSKLNAQRISKKTKPNLICPKLTYLASHWKILVAGIFTFDATDFRMKGLLSSSFNWRNLTWGERKTEKAERYLGHLMNEREEQKVPVVWKRTKIVNGCTKKGEREKP